jgi:serine/threonine-protein kinase
MPLVEGDLVASRFRLIRELGRGGMGAVWLGHHVALDIPCAIKFIVDEAAQDAQMRARFEREARSAARLQSPHVVQILDHGVWEDKPFIVMELLHGEDLAARLRRVERLRPAETVRILEQVARALSKAHAAGIVHRDLKPENIFLARDDDRELAKVLDFGIAKTNHLDAAGTKTNTGALLGTPSYMSPEQADGTRPIDHRSDLWSLAVVAFECLTGRVPFKSDALGDLLMRIMSRPIPTLTSFAPDLPPALDAWWERAAARPPDERFQSAKELCEALALALSVPTESDAGTAGSAPSPASPAPPRAVGSDDRTLSPDSLAHTSVNSAAPTVLAERSFLPKRRAAVLFVAGGAMLLGVTAWLVLARTPGAGSGAPTGRPAAPQTLAARGDPSSTASVRPGDADGPTVSPATAAPAPPSVEPPATSRPGPSPGPAPTAAGGARRPQSPSPPTTAASPAPAPPPAPAPAQPRPDPYAGER